MEKENHKKDFYDPHGGCLIWIVISTEMLILLAFTGGYFYSKNQNPTLFIESQKHLNQSLATINTILLITSGYLLAMAQRSYQTFKAKTLGLLTLLASIMGTIFLIIKFTEYAEKISANMLPGENEFYDFYWMTTSFHAAHVIFGVLTLFLFSYLFLFKADDFKNQKSQGSFNTLITYWHFCDMMWIIIFGVIYLL